MLGIRNCARCGYVEALHWNQSARHVLPVCDRYQPKPLIGVRRLRRWGRPTIGTLALWLCAALDLVPTREDGRWLHGGWGCRWGLSTWAFKFGWDEAFKATTRKIG